MPPRRTSLKKSLRAIERAFAEIEASIAQLANRVLRTAQEASRRPEAASREGRKLHITPKRRAQLKLQGLYMGYVRHLGPRQKARVKAVKEKRGFEAAVKAAKRMAL